jgi:hypothetical protein
VVQKTVTSARLREIASQMKSDSPGNIYAFLDLAANTIDHLTNQLASDTDALVLNPPVLSREALAARVQVLEAAIKDTLAWIEIRHRPPVRDEVETGQMVYVRLHALADLAAVYNGETPVEDTDTSRLTQLVAENTELRKAVAAKVVDSMLLTSLTMSGNALNIGLEGGAARLLAESFAQQFREQGGANYLEMQFTAQDGLALLVTLQNREGKTPSQFRAEADAALALARHRIAEMEAASGEQAVNALRYRYARTLNARQFAEICQENISTGKHFDTLMDERMALLPT